MREFGGRIPVRSWREKLVDIVYAKTGVSLSAGDKDADRSFQYAVATLLALVAQSDGSVSTEEVERIVVILRKKFQIEAGTALELMTSAFHDLPEQHGTKEIFAELNQLLSLEQKEDLAVEMLEVIAADGQKEAGEMQLLALAVFNLGIPNKSMNRAYERYFRTRQGRSQTA